jgi:hypothetical protein
MKMKKLLIAILFLALFTPLARAEVYGIHDAQYIWGIPLLAPTVDQTSPVYNTATNNITWKADALTSSPTFTGTTTLTGPVVIGETLGAELAGTTCAEYTYAGATTCTDAPLTFTRTASVSNLTIIQTTQTIAVNTAYRVSFTDTISASTIIPTLGGIAGTAQTASGSPVAYVTAATTGKLIFTFTSSSAGTITVPSVKVVTSVITSGSAAPVTINRSLTSTTIEGGVTIGITGTKTLGTVYGLNINDNGSGGLRYGIYYNVLGVAKFSIDNSGNLVAAGAIAGTSLYHATGNDASLTLGTVRTFTTATPQVILAQQTSSGSNTAQVAVKINPTWNQTSTAGATILQINSVETALGSGAQKFVSFQAGAAGTTEVYNVTNKGHVNTGTGNTVPVLSSCGTGSPVAQTGSNDHAGRFTIGATGAGCTVTFGTAYTNIPSCPMSGTAAITSVTVTNSTIVLVGAVGTYNYICVGLNE